MEDILRKLYGDAVTEESLVKFKEELGKRFVPKADFNQRGEELKMLKEQLETMEQEKAELEQVKQNNEALEKTVSGLSEQHEKEMADAKAREENLCLIHAIEKALLKEKARNLLAVRALLNMEGIELKDGQLVGLDEQIKALKQENGYLFESLEGNLQFTRPTGGDFVMSQEDFQKLGYMEKLKLKKEQPDLYQKLLKNSGGKNLWQRI